MELKWFGQAAFKLSDVNGTRVITDPYTPDLLGYAPIEDPADLVIISSHDDQAHCRADLIKGHPAVINALDTAVEGGHAEAAGVSVAAIEAAEWEHHPRGVPGQNGMYRFELDGLKIAHMGDVGNPLNERQITFFEDVDVLLALAGGYLTIELPHLDEMIKRTKPKIVVPMHFRTLTYKPRNTMWIESFLSYHDDAQVDFAFSHTVELSPEELPDTTRILVMDYVR